MIDRSSLAPEIETAVEVVGRGGILAYPTEAVYGLGCDPANGAALERLLSLKQRPRDYGFILIAASLEQLEPYLDPLTTEIRARVSAHWPGPETWVLPAPSNVSVLLRGAHRGLAVRVTAHALAARLCEACGHPLVSTSANRTGQPPARTATEVAHTFGHEIEFILPGETSGLIQPTRIRDVLTGKTLR